MSIWFWALSRKKPKGKKRRNDERKKEASAGWAAAPTVRYGGFGVLPNKQKPDGFLFGENRPVCRKGTTRHCLPTTILIPAGTAAVYVRMKLWKRKFCLQRLFWTGYKSCSSGPTSYLSIISSVNNLLHKIPHKIKAQEAGKTTQRELALSSSFPNNSVKSEVIPAVNNIRRAEISGKSSTVVLPITPTAIPSWFIALAKI